MAQTLSVGRKIAKAHPFNRLSKMQLKNSVARARMLLARGAQILGFMPLQ